MRTTALTLLAGTSLNLIAAPAQADVVVTTTRTTPVRTSVDGDVTVKKDGSIEVSGQVPVVIDSGATLNVEEEGEIVAGSQSDMDGVRVTTTSSFTFSNDGTISVEEDFVPADDDNNGIVDGPIARASNRAGLRLVGATQGSITNEGTIKVEGLRSYGLVADGRFTGNIVNKGLIQVVGDYSIAMKLRDVNGSVTLEGSVGAVGEGSQALVVDGDISGSLVVQGSLGTSASFTDDKDRQKRLSRTDVRVRAPAVEIKGDVAGGILLAAPPYDLDDKNKDEDGDGVEDSKEGTAAIRSFGVSPALMIGGDTASSIGGVKGRDGTFSLAVDGLVSADAYYSATNSVAVEIGGRETTTLANGIGVSGNISAQTVDSGAIALLLNETAVVPSLTNSGTINASISSPGEGSTIAVLDRSGTLRNIANSGTIQAGGSSEDERVALDLSRANGSVEIKQFLNDIDKEAKRKESEKDGYNPDNPPIYAAIYGDIRLGAFNDVITASTGVIGSRVYFGAGDDRLSLSDDALFTGEVYGGTGRLDVSLANSAMFRGLIDAAGQAGLLTLSDKASFVGTFANAGQFRVQVDGGTLTAEDGEVVRFGQLNVGSNGSIGVVIDGEERTNSRFEVGSATFAAGAKVKAEITSITKAEGEYTILTAGQITGSPTFDATTSDIPLLFNGTLTSTGTSITLSLRRKSTTELGFGAAEEAAYGAIIAQLDEAETLQSSILQASSIEALQDQFRGLLPDYRGGVFDYVTRANQTVTRKFETQTQDLSRSGENGAWLEPFAFRSVLSRTDEAEKTRLTGGGIAGGFDWLTGLGTLGVDITYASGKIRNGDRQTLDATIVGGGLSWRKRFGQGYAFARVTAGSLSVKSKREFLGEVDGGEVTYRAEGDWGGLTASGTLGGSADFAVGDRLTFRPKTLIDIQYVREQSYIESGDDEIRLGVSSRNSYRASALASLTSSFRIGRRVTDGVPLTLDLEAGRRFLISERLGRTRARFEDGDPFRLTAAQGQGSWLGEAKIHWGGTDYIWDVSAGAEKAKDSWSAQLRSTLTVAF